MPGIEEWKNASSGVQGEDWNKGRRRETGTERSKAKYNEQEQRARKQSPLAGKEWQKMSERVGEKKGFGREREGKKEEKRGWERGMGFEGEKFEENADFVPTRLTWERCC